MTKELELAAFLAANNHGNGAFADGDLGMNLIGLDEVDLSRADEDVAALPDTYRKFKQPFFLIGAISPARLGVNRLSG